MDGGEIERRVNAFIESVERLTGAEKGGMDVLKQLIAGADGSHE